MDCLIIIGKWDTHHRSRTRSYLQILPDHLHHQVLQGDGRYYFVHSVLSVLSMQVKKPQYVMHIIASAAVHLSISTLILISPSFSPSYLYHVIILQWLSHAPPPLRQDPLPSCAYCSYRENCHGATITIMDIIYRYSNWWFNLIIIMRTVLLQKNGHDSCDAVR